MVGAGAVNGLLHLVLSLSVLLWDLYGIWAQIAIFIWAITHLSS